MSALTLNRRVLFLSGAAAATLAACNKPAAPAVPTKPQLGTFGFDTAGMDRTVAPGDDFFAYANGNWVKTTEIPADRSSFSSFTVIAVKAEERTRQLIEALGDKSGLAGDEKKIADAYAAFMDEAGIEQKGLAPLKGELDAVAAITDATGLARYLGTTLRADVDLMNATNYYTDRLFGLWVSQDMDAPETVSPYLVQGGLSLPDRSYYVDGDAASAEMRTALKGHIVKVLTLGGLADAQTRAGRVMGLETAIARVHASQVETNDVEKGNNHWSRADFSAKAPGLDWNAYFDAAGLGGQQTFVVWQPAAVSGISALVASQPLEVWKDYLTYRTLDRASPLLPKAFADESFAFYGSTVQGTPQQQPRWKRALAQVDQALGFAVGKLYADKYFPATSKARAETMVKNIVAAFGRRIDGLAWMAPETRARARRKLDTLQVGIGYPDKPVDYSALEIRRDDALGNAARANLWSYRRNLAKLGKPVDRSEWFLLPHEVNALNVPLENRLIFPAAILEAPFFDPAADDAVNYGAIGGVIGHEISHSFDSAGALFDETGKLHNWWQPADFAHFTSSTKALSDQYDGYRPFPDAHVNGELTLGENVADVAGLATAYDAYRASLKGGQGETIDGFTPDQRFFLGWAQNYRSKYREPALRARLKTDVHSPGPYRAATVRNLDAWYAAFDVKPGQALYLEPAMRVKVW
ncbi:MAG: M13 family metallopeptidase [Caulobacteraceae bacterium]|nr:M13 family metallopeptidase [Caulobacteraceae bacterium]